MRMGQSDLMLVAAGWQEECEAVAMSRAKQVLGTALTVLFLVFCVVVFIAGGLGEIRKPRECAKHYPECAKEKIETVLAASDSYLSWMEGPVIRISSVRASSSAISGAHLDLKKVKPPALYEAVHVRLVEATEGMSRLTNIVAPPLSDQAHAKFYGGLERSIPKYQETLRQIQSEIAQLSGGRVETPSAAGSPPATGSLSRATITYTVQSGDTLAKIAARFGVTVEQMVASNDIEDPNLVEVGQVLVIPSP